MGTPNFSKRETSDFFQWIMSSEQDWTYFQMLVKAEREKLGSIDLAKRSVLDQLIEYATAREPGKTVFKYHAFATEYLANADLSAIVDHFFELWAGSPSRKVLVGRRIKGQHKAASDFPTGQDLISKTEIIVTDNYGEELFRCAKDLLRIQAEAVRCLQ